MTTSRHLIDRNFGKVSRPVQWLSHRLLRLAGWRVTGEFPRKDKLVAVFAPHTSNWDFVVIYLMANSFGVKGNFFAKHTVCRPPLGWFMRAVGGIPVVRRRTENLVESAVSVLAEYDRFYLALAPEGTRRYTDHWRTGFYRIATQSDAQILLMYADYEKKETGMGPVIVPTGDINVDFEKIKMFYAEITPRHPENRSDAVLGEPRSGAEG